MFINYIILLIKVARGPFSIVLSRARAPSDRSALHMKRRRCTASFPYHLLFLALVLLGLLYLLPLCHAFCHTYSWLHSANAHIVAVFCARASRRVRGESATNYHFEDSYSSRDSHTPKPEFFETGVCLAPGRVFAMR